MPAATGTVQNSIQKAADQLPRGKDLPHRYELIIALAEHNWRYGKFPNVDPLAELQEATEANNASIARRYRRQPPVDDGRRLPVQDQSQHFSQAPVQDSKPTPDELRTEGLRLHQEVLDGWTAFCFDPAVLDRPVLNDSADPITAKFFAALEEADALQPVAGHHYDEQYLTEYHRQAVALFDAWGAAARHARIDGITGLTADDQRTVHRVQMLLDRALNPAVAAGGRDTILAKAQTIVDGLVSRPTITRDRIRLQIEPAVRRQVETTRIAPAGENG